MHRFFAARDGELARLSSEDSEHALRVLRLKAGDMVELVVEDSRFKAEITDTEGNVCCRLLQPLEDTEAHTQVTLFMGLPKADKMEWIVQKATELGIAWIVPVFMQRSVVKLNEKDAAKKVDRWQKIAREAVKQCGRVQVPVIEPVQTLSQCRDAMRSMDLMLVPWEEAHAESLRRVVLNHDSAEKIGILIGPEGGIDAEEIGQLADIAVPVTLGPRILRTETAAISAIAGVMLLKGELD